MWWGEVAAGLTGAFSAGSVPLWDVQTWGLGKLILFKLSLPVEPRRQCEDSCANVIVLTSYKWLKITGPETGSVGFNKKKQEPELRSLHKTVKTKSARFSRLTIKT